MTRHVLYRGTDAAILKQAAAIRQKVERAQNRERREKMLKMVGKCFKFHNSYGSGKHWWLYAKITGVTSDGYAISQHFQTDCDGKFTMDTNDYDITISHAALGVPESRFQPVSPSTYTNQLTWQLSRALKRFHYEHDYPLIIREVT